MHPAIGRMHCCFIKGNVREFAALIFSRYFAFGFKPFPTMKKLLTMMLLSAVFACTGEKSGEPSSLSLPEVPVLSSDIMTPEVLWTFGRLGEWVVSPNGEMVAYTVSYFNIAEDKATSDIYLADINGKTVRRIIDSPEREFNLQWRPDGKKLGFLSARSGNVQIWEIEPDGSELNQVSDIESGITGFLYSPTQEKILYIQKVKLDASVNDLFPDLPKANARLENDLMYKHWDKWHDYTYNHIFVADYRNGKVVPGSDIMKDEKFDSPMKPFGGMEQLAWSPDGTLIAYSAKKLTGKAYAVSTNSDIYLYNVADGTTLNLTDGMAGYDKNPVFSPDGSRLAWESMERDGYESDKARLYIADLKQGDKVDYSAKFEQSANNLAWHPDGNTLFFVSGIKATVELYSLDVPTGNISRLTNGVHNFSGVAIAGNKLISAKASMSAPPELFIVDPASGSADQLTAINEGMLNQLTMGRVEERWITTTDNQQMLTWVIYPPHFDPSKKYPAVLYCQGGPQGTVSQFWSYRWNFQLMAANDYIIVAPNRRGVPGFGMEWLEQISTDYGGQNIKDMISAIDAVASEPYVDETKLAAAGASYGGFTVNYLAGMHNKRFKAFINHCGIFNLEQMYITTEEMFFVNWDLGGPFWDKSNKVAQKSYSFSPHLMVQNWDTPMLVIHGEKDFRVPYDQGMAAFNAAVMQDIPAQFLYFPEENHWVTGAQNGILWQRVFKSWLDKWLKE